MPKNVLAHVMTRNPSIQTMIGLYLRGLAKGGFTSEADRNHGIKRIGDKSVVVTCTRIENGIDIETEPLSKEGGKIHIPVIADGKIAVAVKHTDILDVIRTVSIYTPLGAVPKQAALNARNLPNSGMQASMWPFPCPGIAARASGYRFGGVNHRVTGLRVPPFGGVNHSATGATPVPEPSILASQVSTPGALCWVAFFAAEAGACLAANQMGDHAVSLYGEEQLWQRLSCCSGGFVRSVGCWGVRSGEATSPRAVCNFLLGAAGLEKLV